jgi:peptidoglycan/xylan/chitin deacetylase (PgdA/CDA1 family)
MMLRASLLGFAFLFLMAGLVVRADAQTPSPSPSPAGNPSRVAVLGYHRFENPARDSLAITPQMFREQMQALKDAGITVISMDDFLAWRKGEKEIPEKSAVITIDDGYNCTYHEAWPILKEFGYPFAFYVYSNYISAGGRSITWDQLAELRDAGVHIGSHSVSHDNMNRPRRTRPENYEMWLENEFTQIKNEIRDKLGIEATTFAYPYGLNNEAVREMGLATGYEALFTVAGKMATRESPTAEIGRFIVQSDKPQTFRAALQFGPAKSSDGGILAGAAPGFPVNPAHGTMISDPLPLLWADLSGIENLDQKSLEMRVSGLGQVPAEFDPATKRVSYRLKQRIHNPQLLVQIRARAGGKRIEESWGFQYDPAAGVISESLLEPPKDAPPTETPALEKSET